MSTIKELAAKLGISERTIRNHRKDGYDLALNEREKIDIDKSVHSYVKYQSEKIRFIKAQQGRELTGNNGNTKEPENAEEWKAEKEKQAAIKGRLANEKDLGEMVPFEAILELYNKPLAFVKRELLDATNQLSKRLPISPEQKKAIDDFIRSSLERLNEKGMDELQPLISEIIERHSKYYSAASEDSDDSMGDD